MSLNLGKSLLSTKFVMDGREFLFILFDNMCVDAIVLQNCVLPEVKLSLNWCGQTTSFMTVISHRSSPIFGRTAKSYVT
jgi:hypothetical protein